MYRVITGSDGRKYLTDEPLLHPPKREWVGLTDEEIGEIYQAHSGYGGDDFHKFARAIEAKLRGAA